MTTFPGGQYIELHSPLHSLDPRTKLFLLLAFAIFIISLGSWWNHLVGLAILVFATAISRVGFKKIFNLLWMFRIFIAITFLIHQLFTPGRGEYHWFIFHISLAGFYNGLLYSIRIVLLMWAASLFGWVTSPVALGDSLESLFKFLKYVKIPPRDVSMVVILAMRFIPTIIDDATKIHWAQKARGGEITGSIIRKVKSIIPMVIPLFVVAFRRADKLAVALEIRGYAPETNRTKMYPLKFARNDYLLFSIGLALMILYLISIAM